MTALWYALRVKPHKERSVHELLQTKEIQTFFPTVRVNPVNPRAAKERPYFPGYIFVRADLDDLGANTFNWLPGSRGLVAFDGEPASVPAHFVVTLRRRLEEIEAAGGLAFDDLHPGDRVEITGGPFAGYEAIFDMRLSGKDRVQVLLAYLNSQPRGRPPGEPPVKPVKINISVAHIKKAKQSRDN